MSREIDLYEPLSEMDKHYLINRGMENQVHENELRFSRSDHVTGIAVDSDADNTDNSDNSDADDNDVDAMSDEEWVDSLTVDELRAELKEGEQSAAGNKPELQERLLLAL